MIWPFNTKQKPSAFEHQEIAAGQQWHLVTPGDPFSPKYKPARILEVRDGWVRYWLGNHFPDERQTIESFVSMYRRVE